MTEFEPTIIDGIVFVDFVKLSVHVINTTPDPIHILKKRDRILQNIAKNGYKILIFNCNEIPNNTTVHLSTWIYMNDGAILNNDIRFEMPEKAQKLLKLLVVL